MIDEFVVVGPRDKDKKEGEYLERVQVMLRDS
jgi:hypothetical protein